MCATKGTPQPRAGPDSPQCCRQRTTSNIWTVYCSTDSQSWSSPAGRARFRDVCGPFKTPSSSRRQKCPRRLLQPSPAPLSAFPAFAAQLPKKNRAIWQHSDSESVFCSDAFAFSTMCPSIFFNVKAFLLAAISRFIREAAHLHPLNASQQQGPFLTQDGLFSSPISADGHRSGHHGNSPAGAAGA